MSFINVVDRVFNLIAADDRRRPTPEEEQAAKRLWRQTFRVEREEALLLAVQTWLQENPRGRPNVGKIREILNRDLPKPSKAEVWKSELQRRDDDALRWAVSILEDPGRFQSLYKHTLDCAEHELRRRGFSHWHNAKGYLEPGWAPVTVTEVYL